MSFTFKNILVFFVAFHWFQVNAQKYEVLNCRNEKIDIQSENQCRKECKPFGNLFNEFLLRLMKFGN